MKTDYRYEALEKENLRLRAVNGQLLVVLVEAHQQLTSGRSSGVAKRLGRVISNALDEQNLNDQ